MKPPSAQISAISDDRRGDERNGQALARLVAIMARLRDRERGCEWDSVQTFATIAPYTIEEAYEVADAIHRDDMADLQGELDIPMLLISHDEADVQRLGDDVLEMRDGQVVGQGGRHALPPHAST